MTTYELKNKSVVEQAAAAAIPFNTADNVFRMPDNQATSKTILATENRLPKAIHQPNFDQEDGMENLKKRKFTALDAGEVVKNKQTKTSKESISHSELTDSLDFLSMDSPESETQMDFHSDVNSPVTEINEEVLSTVVTKIINNDERIDAIFIEMQQLDEWRAKATSSTDLEMIRARYDQLLDELIIRTTSAYCRITNEDVWAIRDFLKSDVKLLKEAMQDKTLLITTIVAGATTILGAATAFFPGGAFGFSGTTVKATGATLSGIGQGGSLTAQYMQVSAQGKVEVIRFEKDLNDNSKRTREDQRAKEIQRIEKSMDLIRSKEHSRHATWESQQT